MRQDPPELLSFLWPDCTRGRRKRYLRWKHSSSSQMLFLFFSLPDNYPCVPPIFEIETNQLGSFNYRDADNLFDLLMEESLKRIGEMMVFDLITLTQEHMPGVCVCVCVCVCGGGGVGGEREREREGEFFFLSGKNGNFFPPSLPPSVPLHCTLLV